MFWFALKVKRRQWVNPQTSRGEPTPKSRLALSFLLGDLAVNLQAIERVPRGSTVQLAGCDAEGFDAPSGGARDHQDYFVPVMMQPMLRK